MNKNNISPRMAILLSTFMLVAAITRSISVSAYCPAADICTGPIDLADFTGYCPRAPLGCPCKQYPMDSTICLGSIDDSNTAPFQLTVCKKELLSDRSFTLLAQGQSNTGYLWMCIDVLGQYEHHQVAPNLYGFYHDELTRESLMDLAENGVAAHGIAVSNFTLKRDESVGDKPLYGIGLKDTMKATLTINSGIQTGQYYVEIAYASPFRTGPIMRIKEVLVNVIP